MSISKVGHAGKKFNNLNSISKVVDFLQTIIWICSGLHAAVNFNQYDSMGFVPNRPISMYGEPPTK